MATWDNEYSGGNSAALREQLVDVGELVPSEIAFAARRGDGSVVAWGGSEGGGSSEAVHGKLAAGIEQVYSADKSFAARTRDGSLVAWGHHQYGGNSAVVADLPAAGVVRVYSTCCGHVAIKKRGWQRGVMGPVGVGPVYLVSKYADAS